MRYDTLPALRVERCTSALQAKDLSRFHRSLLVSARGGAHRVLREYNAAVTDFTKAMALYPKDAEDALVRRGIAYEDEGALDLALGDYTQAIHKHGLDPANKTNGSSDIDAEEHALNGRVLLKLGKPAAAYREFAEADNISPSSSLGIREYEGGVGMDLVHLKAIAKQKMHRPLPANLGLSGTLSVPR